MFYDILNVNVIEGNGFLVFVVVAIVNTQKSRLILVNMEIGCKDPLTNR